MVARRRKVKAPRSSFAKSSRDAVLPETDSAKKGFLPEVLDRTVIAIPLLKSFEKEKGPFHVAIDLNLDYEGGLTKAREKVIREIETLTGTEGPTPSQAIIKSLGANKQYVFATLEAAAIKALVRRRQRQGPFAARHPSHLAGLSAEAADQQVDQHGQGRRGAQRLRRARRGRSSGRWSIRASTEPIRISRSTGISICRPPLDASGLHGSKASRYGRLRARHPRGGHHRRPDGRADGSATSGATMRYRDENGDPTSSRRESSTRDVAAWRRAASCSASRCSTTTARQRDGSSSIIAALQYIQELNGDGRRLLVHGVNLSVGYDFDPEWFACGQSPLCVEVDRLVRSGVVVVVAAGQLRLRLRAEPSIRASCRPA